MFRASSAPRELWFPNVFGGGGSNFGDYRVGPSDFAPRFFSIFIPTDFVSLISAEIIYIKRDSNVQFWTLNSDYAAIGEQYNFQSEGPVVTGAIAETDGEMYARSIAGVLTGIAAGDFAGIQVDPATRARVLGIRFIYSLV